MGLGRRLGFHGSTEKSTDKSKATTRPPQPSPQIPRRHPAQRDHLIGSCAEAAETCYSAGPSYLWCFHILPRSGSGQWNGDLNWTVEHLVGLLTYVPGVRAVARRFPDRTSGGLQLVLACPHFGGSSAGSIRTELECVLDTAKFPGSVCPWWVVPCSFHGLLGCHRGKVLAAVAAIQREWEKDGSELVHGSWDELEASLRGREFNIGDFALIGGN